MSELETLQARNQEFISDFSGENLPIKPAFSTIILSCVDARIDPGHFLNLAPGEVVTFRNTGGRVTADIEREVAALWMMSKQMGGNLELAIIHHDDCGVERFANPQLKQALIQKIGLSEEDVEQRVIHNHEQSLQDDIARLKASKFVPDELVISGHMYHPASGQLEQVIAPIAVGDC